MANGSITATGGRDMRMELPSPPEGASAAGQVIHWHNTARRCGGGMLESAMLAGRVLIDQRELHSGQTKRGGSHFTAWCRGNLPFSRKTVYQYIDIAENWEHIREKLSPVGDNFESPASIRDALKLIAERKPKPTPKPKPAEAELIDSRADHVADSGKMVETDQIVDANKMVEPATVREIRTVQLTDRTVKDSLTVQADRTCKDSLQVATAEPVVKESLTTDEEPPRPSNGSLFGGPEPNELSPIERAREAVQAAIDAVKALDRDESGEDYRTDDALAGIRQAQRMLAEKTPETDRQVDQIRLAYPRKTGIPTARRAIVKALGFVDFEELLAKTCRYAVVVRDADESSVPHPGTWFNDQRYLDSEREWALSAGVERKQRESEKTSRRNGRSVSDYLAWAERRSGREHEPAA